MLSYTFLQNYWWFLISLLGAILVFLMFVQGANVFLAGCSLSNTQKQMIINSTGRKWELAFTTLVTFGGAFFASFPLFYSTSFGGAYWVWILLLITFVFHAVSYEFMSKKGNILGVKGFRIALIANGVLAPFVVGTAVGTFFTGSNFTVNKLAITDLSAPVISTWGSSWRGLEALAQPHAVLLGLSLVGLTFILGGLYLINNIDDADLEAKIRKGIRIATLPFIVVFLAWVAILLTKEGYAVDGSGSIVMEKYKYLHNLLQMPGVLVMLVVGVLLVLSAIWAGAFTKCRKGIWAGGLGTVLVVMAVFFVAGYNDTAYYPSYADLQSSLTIRNSSSSQFTLQVMACVSLLIPFVLAYIVYAWHAMDKKKITSMEIEETEHKY